MADIPFAPITIGDRKIEVAMEWVKGKSMTARLKNGRIQIRIPQHLGKNAALPHADMLLGRLTKRILKDPERYLGRKIKRLVFKGPGRLTLMGRPLEITIEESGRLHKRAKIWGIEIGSWAGAPDGPLHRRTYILSRNYHQDCLDISKAGRNPAPFTGGRMLQLSVQK